MKDKDQKFLKLCRERLAQGLEAQSSDKKEAQDDLEFAFIPGKQWDDDVKLARGKDRPALEYNKLPSFLARVKNAMRMNRYGIQVRPKSGDADKDIASIMAGKIRDIEQTSDCEEYQDGAGQTSSACGRGFLIVQSRYIKGSFDQELYIDGLADAFAVIWDPAAKNPDLQDADWFFIITELKKSEFEAKYPDSQVISLVEGEVSHASSWSNGESVIVADYYYRGEEKKRKLIKIRAFDQFGGESIQDVYEDELEDLKKADQVARIEPVTDKNNKPMERTESYKPWMYCQTNGIDQLSEAQVWINDKVEMHPLVPVWGERAYIDNKWHTWGMVRHVRDTIKSRNYAKTVQIERLALEPKAPWLGGKNQLAGHEADYHRSRKENVDLLTYNDDPDETTAQMPPSRVFPEPPSQAAMLIAQQDDQDMHDIVGIPYTATHQDPNTAGVATAQMRMEGDIATFVYPDEMAKSMKRLGRILVDYIPYIYDTARLERIRAMDGAESMVPVNASEAMFPQDYKEASPKVESTKKYSGQGIFNDLSQGKYDVIVDTGPQFVTLRHEVLTRWENFITKYPPAFPLIADLLAKMQDTPESEAFEKRLKYLVPPELREPEDGEQIQPQQPPPPDPKTIEVLGKLKIAERNQAMKELKTILDGVKTVMEAEQIRTGIQVPGMVAYIDALANQYMGGPQGGQMQQGPPGPPMIGPGPQQGGMMPPPGMGGV